LCCPPRPEHLVPWRSATSRFSRPPSCPPTEGASRSPRASRGTGRASISWTRPAESRLRSLRRGGRANWALSPDGKWIAGKGSDDRVVAYPLAGGEPRPIPGVAAGEEPVQWSADGSSLFLARFGELPLRIDRLDLATGRRERWKELLPADRAGLIRIRSISIARDGKSYAYSYDRVLSSDLVVAENLK
jgi:hypothetical protein